MSISSIILFSLFVLLAFVFDVWRGIIPNMLNAGGAIAGLSRFSLEEGWSGLCIACMGMLVGFTVTYGLYAIDALAAGDVKWFAAVGAIIGPIDLLYLLMGSVMIAAFIALVMMLYRRRWRAGTFPFMCAVLPSSVGMFVVL